MYTTYINQTTYEVYIYECEATRIETEGLEE